MLEELLAEVAAAAKLREGAEGVRRILELAGRTERIGIRQLARKARLPVPVVAAVRRELERRDMLRRDRGIVLSERGRSLLAASGMTSAGSFACPHCAGRRVVTPAALAPIGRAMAAACRSRPRVDVRLDQSHGTAQTALLRAVYMHECEALCGRRALVLGDDDLQSVAMALLARHLGPDVALHVTVVDVDPRVLDHIDACARHEGVTITTRRLDLRQPLPDDLREAFDVFITDPPYTREGLRLFASRALQGMAPGPGRQGFVSYAHRSPGEMLCLCGELVGMGLSISEIVPEFNRYEGAQILAGSSQMIRVATAREARPAWEGPCPAPIYTAEVAAAAAERSVA